MEEEGEEVWTGQKELRPQNIQKRGQQRRKGEYADSLGLLHYRSS